MESDPKSASIRITNGGKIKSWVTYALEYLENEENNSNHLILHTLPAASKSQTNSTSAENATTKHLGNATSAIPRLVTVVEIIKREYIKLLEQKHSSRLTGLHQYNEFGSLEELGMCTSDANVNEEDQRAERLKMALEGKNYPKQKQTPYMKITLSHMELPELVEKGATYQSPLKRKLSKSARARAKKRQKKDEANKQAGPTSAAPASVPS
ncbi:hypothetical protein WG66_011756 [Moniliophthora roreri]|uniref:Uncharacterized protein n=1 Tax=Moniliophthora roreri TaxID=221103 RepID=A0A0W0F5T9_MONRR|nr:hypothetical protein WG66_011756 [Moniliophthora roreri]